MVTSYLIIFETIKIQLMFGYLIAFIIISYLFNLFFKDSPFRKIKRTHSQDNWYENNSNSYRPKDFETSLLVLASVIIKADGVINQIEVDYVRNYFVQNYGKEIANKSFQQFRTVIQQRISTRQTWAEIGRFMPYQARIHLIKFLFGVACADGQITQGEELEIRKIASYLLIGQHDYLHLRAIYFQNQRQKQQQNYSSTYSKNSNYEYEILGLTKSASNDTIKKAYRTLVKKYHPDRLQNASEQDIVVAKEKFQKIQSAYEKIKEKRGF